MGAPKGKKISEEHRLKISNTLKGKIPKNIKMIAGWNKGGTSWSKGKHLSKEHREKIGKANKETYKNLDLRMAMSKRMKGLKSPFWKGGLTKKNYNERVAIMNSMEYKLWREAVFKRDNWTCIWCNTRSGNGKTVILNADHIKSFRNFPELRFTIDNGRTLCLDCHKTTDTWGRPKEYAEQIHLLSDLL